MGGVPDCRGLGAKKTLGFSSVSPSSGRKYLQAKAAVGQYYGWCVHHSWQQERLDLHTHRTVVMVFLVLEGDILSEAKSNNLLNKIKYLEMLTVVHMVYCVHIGVLTYCHHWNGDMSVGWDG